MENLWKLEWLRRMVNTLFMKRMGFLQRIISMNKSTGFEYKLRDSEFKLYNINWTCNPIFGEYHVSKYKWSNNQIATCMQNHFFSRNWSLIVYSLSFKNTYYLPTYISAAYIYWILPIIKKKQEQSCENSFKYSIIQS